MAKLSHAKETCPKLGIHDADRHTNKIQVMKRHTNKIANMSYVVRPDPVP